MSEPTYLPIAEAARRIGRKATTLMKWVRAGRLKAVRLPDAQGSLYVLAADLHLADEATSPEPARRTRRRKGRTSEDELREMGVL